MRLVTSTNLTLRPAQARDVEPIAIMSRELIESGLGWRYRPDKIRRLIRDPDTVVLVATNHERVWAFAVMEFGDERAHLVLLAVHPAHRRQGTGRRMIGWLLESAATAGIASVHLEVRAGNAVAHAFYRALGFVDTQLIAGYYRGQESAIRMMRVLLPQSPVISPWKHGFGMR